MKGRLPISQQPTVNAQALKAPCLQPHVAPAPEQSAAADIFLFLLYSKSNLNGRVDPRSVQVCKREANFGTLKQALSEPQMTNCMSQAANGTLHLWQAYLI